jgi:pilus assembly protein CpaF
VSASATHRNGARRLADALDQPVQAVTARVADRLIDAVERDAETPSDSPLATDERRQQLLVGAWINDEINVVNEDRLRSGLRPLDIEAEQTLCARVVADLTGSGPLEPYLNDENVEEIDVNSATSTWVTFANGHKVDVGALWNSTAELIAFQKRLALRMKGTGEGRLDTSSPMLTMQSNEGSRIVMVLGGDSEHGISTHPRIAIRRFVVRQAGLEGLAKLGLFPIELTAQLRALVRCGFTMLISGPPGAGKTTLLTELLGEVSPLERIITVEKNLLELRLEDDPRHPDAPALFTRHANAEELVEDEALDMLDVASMCKRGSLATIHAHTSDIVLQRLAYYVSKSNTNLPEFAVWSLIAQTVDFVVHIDLVRNASDEQSVTTRRITSIVEVGGLGEQGGVSATEVWGLKETGELEQVAGLSPRHLNRLRVSGYSPDQFAMRGVR